MSTAAAQGQQRRRRPIARLLRIWVPWALGWSFVFLAVGSLTGRILSSQLEGSEAAVAERLAAATGFEVRIEGLQGRFLDWDPVLEVAGLALSRGGHETLTAGRVRLKLDLFEAVTRRQPLAAVLVVDDLRLQLERGVDGTVGLRGGGGGEAPDPEPIVSFLYHSDHVDLRAARVELYDSGAPAQAPPRAWLDVDGVLVGNAFDHRGHLSAELADAEGVLATADVHLDLDGEPLDPESRAGRMLFALRDVDLAGIGRVLGEAATPLSGVLEEVRVRADVDPRLGTEFVARLSATHLGVEGETPVHARNLRLDLEGHARRARDGDLRVREFRVAVGEEPVGLDGARLAWREGREGDVRLFGELGELDAGSLARLASSLGVLGPRAERWLANLAPAARVEGVRFAVEPAARTGAVAVAVSDLSLRGYRGVPRVRGVDGQAVAYEGGVWIDVDTDAFYLQFPDVFAEGWRYDAAAGRIDLRFDPGGLHVRSDLVRIEGPQGRAAGHFALYLPRDERERRISLALGIEDADAAFTEAFLPGKLEPQLRGWLARSVRAGRVDRGAVLINGAVKQTVREDRATGLWFDLRAGRLAFDPAWPTATSLSGRVLVARDGVRGELTSGRLAGLEMNRTRFLVPRDDLGERVELAGLGRGDGRAVLEFLRDAPLGDDLAFLEDDWSAAGSVDFGFEITVPLDGTELAHLDVDADLLLERLRVGQANLEFGAVAGRLAYRHPGYLTSSGARAELFGGPVDLRLEGSFAEGAEGLVVDGRGVAEGRAVADWLRIDVLARLGGSAAYDSRMRVRPDGRVELAVASPVPGEGESGLLTSLPPPLEAPAAPLRVSMVSEPDGPMDILLEWGDFASRFELVDGGFERGTLALAAPLGELPAVGLSAVGRAASVDVDAWLDTIERWQQDAIIFGDDDGASVDDLLLDFAIEVDDARWGAQRFGPTSVTLTGFLADMTFGFEAQRLVGRVLIPEGDAPLDVALDRLDLPLDPALSLERPDGEAGDASAAAPADAAKVADAERGGAIDARAEGQVGAVLTAADDAPSGEEGSGESGESGESDEGGEGGEGDADPSLAQLLADLDPASVPAMDVRLGSFSDHGEDLGSASFAVRPWGDGVRLVDIRAEGRGLSFGPDAEGHARIELGLVPWPSSRIVGRLAGEDAVRVARRFGLAPSIDAQSFAFELDVGWEGPLDDIELASLAGSIDVDVARGRFLEIDAGGGPLRMVGLLNVDAIARRMRLDFTDIYRRGVAFEEIDGVLTFDAGRLLTTEPVRISGPQSRIVLTGDLEMASRALDGELVVTLPVSNNLPWAAAYAALVNPVAGAGVFVAERLFREQIDKYSSARYRITGTVDEPEVVFDTIFENETARPPGDDEAGGDDSAEPLAVVTDPSASASEEP